jgi:hypothetical protein
MSQSGRNTKIRKSQLGAPHFPFEKPNVGTGYMGAGPVREYKLSEEERLALIARYGPVDEKKKLYWDRQKEFRRKRQTEIEPVSEPKIEQEELNEVDTAEIYTAESKSDKPKTRLEIAREKLTKELIVQLKSEGLGDKRIREKYGVANAVYYRLKKEYGLTGQSWGTKEQLVQAKVEPEKEACFRGGTL